MKVSYLIVFFDVNRGMYPSQVEMKYIDKEKWQVLQRDDLLTIIELGESNDQYEIIHRRSFVMPDSITPKMVLVVDIKKIKTES